MNDRINNNIDPKDNPESIPLFSSSVPAGFPSPAESEIEGMLNLHHLIVKHPAATFFVKAQGESMRNAGIQSGDIIVVDRSIAPSDKKIVVAIIDGEFTVKRLRISPEGIFLDAENPHFPSIKIDADTDYKIWGVVTYVIHKAL